MQEFDSIPPGRLVLLLPLALLLVPLGALVAIFASADANADGAVPWALVFAPILVAPAVAALMVKELFSRRFRLSPEGLRVRDLPWPRTIAVGRFDLERAEIVDLGRRPELMPRFKIAGTRLPGFRSGRFRLRDKRVASVFLTELGKVLVLPLRDGSVVMLSLQRPEALLQALRQRAQGRTRG